ncbi:unnamed protein product, partial [Meganyctiphanes norvegica]
DIQVITMPLRRFTAKVKEKNWRVVFTLSSFSLLYAGIMLSDPFAISFFSQNNKSAYSTSLLHSELSDINSAYNTSLLHLELSYIKSTYNTSLLHSDVSDTGTISAQTVSKVAQNLLDRR